MKDIILKDREYWHKGLSILACVGPLVADAQLCLAVGDSYKNHGCFLEALDYYERAEKGFLRAEQRWQEILEKPFSAEFTGLKSLITTGYYE